MSKKDKYQVKENYKKPGIVFILWSQAVVINSF